MVLTLIFDLFPGYLWMLIVRENREDVKEKGDLEPWKNMFRAVFQVV